jgi:hypothetical protein
MTYDSQCIDDTKDFMPNKTRIKPLPTWLKPQVAKQTSFVFSFFAYGTSSPLV